ncbi:predicted protein [Naegleria gruberi]|uniref:Predicted protein n=1 Tax=Naegleria gruberi TaxID=5762 RepID=D2V2P2_NAEGR|nr:uncharacterized protein NAEGRDRAFT_63068 [Naegleria gruberi]EFC48928.1 predicted protein [Naegleria gruberi]|eukprot:XP_002681672.1 predicted protein [Naegleria gruberi strain NEG-M]
MMHNSKTQPFSMMGHTPLSSERRKYRRMEQIIKHLIPFATIKSSSSIEENNYCTTSVNNNRKCENNNQMMEILQFLIRHILVTKRNNKDSINQLNIILQKYIQQTNGDFKKYLPIGIIAGLICANKYNQNNSTISNRFNIVKNIFSNSAGILKDNNIAVTIHHLSMIEILIAISIIVTFSGLTGAVLAQVYEESRVSNALLDLAKLQEGLVLYFTRHGKYPLSLEDLLEGGELNKVPKDPWGTDYLYVPHLDWNRLNRILLTTTTSNSGNNSTSQQQLTYFNEVLKRMETVLITLPGGVTPMSLLAIANEQPFCICVGTKIPRFPSKIDVDVSRERIRYVANLMKMSMERSSVAGSVQSNNQQGVTSIMNQITELNARIKNILNVTRQASGGGE